MQGNAVVSAETDELERAHALLNKYAVGEDDLFVATRIQLLLDRSKRLETALRSIRSAASVEYARILARQALYG